jgi:hypothetical protein
LSVTQEKSFDLGSVDECCGGTYGSGKKYKAQCSFLTNTFQLMNFKPQIYCHQTSMWARTAKVKAFLLSNKQYLLNPATDSDQI